MRVDNNAHAKVLNELQEAKQELSQLRAQVKSWEDKEVSRAACCAENEAEVEKIRSQLEMAKKALQWEEKRCGRLHGPLADALKRLEGK